MQTCQINDINLNRQEIKIPILQVNIKKKMKNYIDSNRIVVANISNITNNQIYNGKNRNMLPSPNLKYNPYMNKN